MNKFTLLNGMILYKDIMSPITGGLMCQVVATGKSGKLYEYNFMQGANSEYQEREIGRAIKKLEEMMKLEADSEKNLDDYELTRAIINATRGWNGGYGLILPPHVGKLLRQIGIKDGYTITKKAKLTDMEGVVSK